MQHSGGVFQVLAQGIRGVPGLEAHALELFFMGDFQKLQLPQIQFAGQPTCRAFRLHVQRGVRGIKPGVAGHDFGNHLVVGHSNTPPMLVEALGGAPGGPIGEDEYDRLYVVTLAPDGPVHTALLRIPDPGVP